MKYTHKLLFIMCIGIFTTGCTSSSVSLENAYIYKGMNFGSDRDEAFKRGVQDGCRTASGTYTKDREAFNANRSYKDGWGDGRLQCHGK